MKAFDLIPEAHVAKPSWRAVVTKFVQDNAELENPGDSFNTCRITCVRLYRKLDAAGIPARVWRFEDPKTFFPNAHEEWLDLGKQSYWVHYMVEVGGMLVDLTRRQFDPKAPVPYIAPQAEEMARWGEAESIATQRHLS